MTERLSIHTTRPDQMVLRVFTMQQPGRVHCRVNPTDERAACGLDLEGRALTVTEYKIKHHKIMPRGYANMPLDPCGKCWR